MKTALGRTRGARSRRHATLLGAIAGGSALLLTLATGPAQAAGTAGTIDIGHVDGLHVALNEDGDQLVLGSNVDEDDYLPGSGFEAGYYPGSEVDATHGTPEYDFTVPAANFDYEPTAYPDTWVLPADEPPSFDTDPILYLGIAGTGEDLPAHGTSGPDVAYSLFNGLSTTDHITFDISLVSAPAGGASDIPSADVLGANEWGLTFDLGGSATEPIHHHFDWTFSHAGVYTFAVTASSDNAAVADSAPVVYQFTVES